MIGLFGLIAEVIWSDHAALLGHLRWLYLVEVRLGGFCVAWSACRGNHLALVSFQGADIRHLLLPLQISVHRRLEELWRVESVARVETLSAF